MIQPSLSSPGLDSCPDEGSIARLSPTREEIQASERARMAAIARNASGRRRRIDPITSERDYSKAEMEFLNAIQEYKRTSGRMFPSDCEVLKVLRSLGYEKPPE